MITDYIPNRNIFTFYIFTFFRWLSFWVPVYTVFYTARGFGLGEINTLIAIRSITAIILEVPSGVIADFLGRKTCLILGSILQIFGFVFLLLNESYPVAILANILIGAMFAFSSGADQSLVYDSLLESKQEDKFKKVLLANSAITATSLAGASLGCSLIVKFIGVDATILFNLVAYCLALVAALFLSEPQIKNSSNDRNFFKHILISFKTIRTYKLLMALSILLAVIIAASDASQTLRQQLLVENGVNQEWLGILNMIFLASASAVSFLILITSDKFRNDRIIIGLGFSIMLVHLIILSSFTALIQLVFAMCIGQIAKGVISIASDDFTNRNIESGNRSTILSMQNFLISIVTALSIPVFGYIADYNSIATAYLYILIFILVVGLPALILIFKRD